MHPARLILQPVKEPRPPFWTSEDDYSVMWRAPRSDASRPCERGAALILNDMHRNRMDGRCATREDATAAFREALDRVPDNTVDKSA